MCSSRSNKEAPERGFRHKRKCRDVCCIAMFGLFWVGMGVIASIAGESGDVARLLFGVDYKGRTCGTVAPVTERRRIVFPRMTEDLVVNFGVRNPLDYHFYGICVDECPPEHSILCNDEGPFHLLPASPGLDYCWHTNDRGDYLNQDEPVKVGNTSIPCSALLDQCWRTPMRMASVFWRCVPVYETTWDQSAVCVYPPWVSDPADPACVTKNETVVERTRSPAQENLLYEQMNQIQSVWTRWIGDVQRAWWVIAIAGLLLPMALGFAWLLILKYFTKIFVWTLLVLLVLMSIATTLLCYVKAGILDPAPVRDALSSRLSSETELLHSNLWPSDENAEHYRTAAILLTVGVVLLVLLILAVRKTIRNVVRVVAHATDALNAQPSLLFTPLLVTAASMVLYMYWVWISAMMMSAGDTVRTDHLATSLESHISSFEDTFPGALSDSTVQHLRNHTGSVVESLRATRYLLVYHTFGVLWASNVLHALGLVTMTGAIAYWYFHGEAQPWGVLQSFGRAMRHHLGSLMFGSFLMTVFVLSRRLLRYLHHHLSVLERRAGAHRVLTGMTRFGLYLVGKCLEIANFGAYSVIAIRGTSYIASARTGLLLIITNVAHATMLHTLTLIMVHIGALLIACICAVVAVGAIDSTPQFQAGGDLELTASWLPALLASLLSYATARSFFTVYVTTTEAVMMSAFLEDMEGGGRSAHGRALQTLFSDEQGEEVSDKPESRLLAEKESENEEAASEESKVRE